MNSTTVQIEDLAFGGDGLARINGKVVFIPFSLPGEELEIQIVSEKRDFARGKILSIQNGSPLRVEPKCPHFGSCGGCQLQHISYEEQLRVKGEWAKSFLNRLQEEKIDWLSPVGADPVWHYRARIQLHGESNGDWGFYRVKSHQVVPINECPITNPAIMRVFSELKPLLSPKIMKIELTGSDQKKEVLLGLPSKHGLKNIKKIGRIDGIYFLDPHSAMESSPSFMDRKVLGFTLRSTGGTFMQNHEGQNQNLVQVVLDFFRGSKRDLREKIIWDLYSGNGNFSIPLASQCKEVYGIEENPLSHEDALWNVQENKMKNIFCLRGKVKEVWPNLNKVSPTPHGIVLDPPRTGAKEEMADLVSLRRQIERKGENSPQIVYVSCDLAALARDLKVLIQGGYRIKRARVLDLFPQTSHLETVVWLA